MARLFDRVIESSTTTGTGDFTLAAAITGYRRFADVLSTGQTCPYWIQALDTNGNPSGAWEVGLGTYSAANTLTRTTVEASSNAGAAVNFAAGTKYVSLDCSAAFINKVRKAVITLAVTDPNGSALTTGDGKMLWRVPSLLDGYDLSGVAGCLGTVSSSGIPTIQLRRKRSGSDVDMLSTKLTIDANETDSSTAATAAVIDTSNDDVATGDQIYIDCDVAGTGAKGLVVELEFKVQ